jgi:Mg2+ and Co2+ transporter CorA
MRRTELRRGLQQHVIGLRRAIETDTTIKVKKKPCLAEMIQDIDISTMAVLDDVEKSVRELLQIEFAWVSINEAASTKRLSWITVIFVPLMFVSSLFGMNVDILRNSPDWRWYLLFSALSFLLTVAIWASFRFVRIDPWMRGKGLLTRKNKDAGNSAHTTV